MLKVQRLNMDNSWMIHIENAKILVDPWLFGVEIDYFPWFNKQWHRTKPLAPEKLDHYDFCLITQKYPDHFHKETLSVIRPDKIVGPKSIKRYVKKLLPQSQFIAFEEKLENVFDIGVNLHHLPTKRRIDPIYDALIMQGKQTNVFMATHGFKLTEEKLKMIKEMGQMDLLISPFNKYKLPALLGGFVSPGMESLETLIEQIQPHHVVPTHDEDKHAKGLVSKFAKITWAPKTEEIKSNPILAEKYLDIQDYQIHEL